MVTVESYFTVVQSVPIGSAAQDWCSLPVLSAALTAAHYFSSADGACHARPNCSTGTCRRHRRSLKLHWLRCPALRILTALQGYECLGKHRM